MSTGARGLTLVRASELRASESASARARSSLDASAVAWELAAQARFDRALATAHEALATLAFDVAEGVIGRSVSCEPAALEAMVSQAIARARGARRLLVCAHPDDVAEARRAVSEALSDAAPVEWVEVAADPSVARGCVAVETARGRVVADWAESLSLARSRWIASLKGPRG
jgi:flagellar biosynthesis/type III secretory pathway protein FliH